jgi:hypothetical protein
MADHLYFECVKEHRGSYFVEYRPPVSNNKFATLGVIFLKSVSWEDVRDFVEKEIRFWLGRYPVPLMVSAWDDAEAMLRPLGSDRGFLVAWVSPDNGEIKQSWDVKDLDRYLEKSFVVPDWRKVYANLQFRTQDQVKSEALKRASKQAKQVRFLKFSLILWLVAIPAGYALIEFFGPEWLGFIGLSFVLWKAFMLSLRIWGRAKPSPKELEKAEKQRKMEHYFYHCERNPTGFWRLKNENFESDSRERVRSEADEIATKPD